MSGQNLISATPAKPKKGKSGVVIPNAPTFSQRLLARLLWAVLRLIAATLRYRVRDPHGFL
ncbi:MAG TPA: hypothetical protein VMV89_12740, partial [Candidatus Paceibacterota bacterium]|nr:hypothetical protein [Candidatus Paceibacterota bacterium]